MKELRKYQRDMIDSIKVDLTTNKEVVMAMCPNAGKTFTTIKLIEEFLLEGSITKVLILAHGTTVLRSQFYQNLIEESPNFTFKELSRTKKDLDSQVIVCLPQGLNGIDLTQFDFIVVDEAHERYLAKMGQRIIEESKVDKVLLLTGTPSKFINKNTQKQRFKINIVAMSDIPREYMANTHVYVCPSNYDICEDDYNKDNNLKKYVNFKDIDTKSTVNSLIDKVKDILNIDCSISDVFNELSKTMIICHSQSQAKYIGKYLTESKVNSLVSTHEVDLHSENVSKFIKDANVSVLIIVNRGILGFNLPELVNVVDMSGTRNIDRMYQAFSRVTRTHEDITVKRYFKFSSTNDIDNVEYITSAMLSLIHRDNLELYNGCSINNKLPILTEVNRSNTKNPTSIKLVKFQGLDIISEFTRKYNELDNNKHLYSKTMVYEILSRRININYNYALEKAKLSTSYIDFRRKYSSCYNYILRNGIEYKLCSIMNWSIRNKHTFKECLNVAKQCKSSSEFRKNFTPQYLYLSRLDLLSDVFDIMKWGCVGKEKRIFCTNNNKEYPNIKQAANDLGCNPSAISKVCRGKLKSTHGYSFKFINKR